MFLLCSRNLLLSYNQSPILPLDFWRNFSDTLKSLQMSMYENSSFEGLLLLVIGSERARIYFSACFTFALVRFLSRSKIGFK